MSVSLLIERHGSATKNDLLPIATEQFFETFWQPLSARLHLYWVPLFQGGIPVAREDIPFILEELCHINDYLLSADANDLEAEAAQHIRVRNDALIARLRELQGDEGTDLYIG